MQRITLVIAAIFLIAVSALAQGTTGRLSGTVSGPDGAIPGATVTVTDINTKKEQTVTANEEGSFLFPQLEFGTYSVRITAAVTTGPAQGPRPASSTPATTPFQRRA